MKDLFGNNSNLHRIYKAIILNDYPHAAYATKVKNGEKTIETRMDRMFKHRGDIIICCGASNSVGPNAGKAIAMVEIWKGRPMKDDPAEIEACGIGYDPRRKCLLLRNWRWFSRDFEYQKCHWQGSYQSIFEIRLPEDVQLIPQPQIIPFNEK